MYEKEQSRDILIEWDVPKPTFQLKPNHRLPFWYQRLRPFTKQIGRRGRILRNVDTYAQINIKRNDIKRSLRNHDPYQRWKVEVAREDDATYSLWVTYEGRMNEDEYLQYERERAARYDKMKRRMNKNRAAKQEAVIRSALSGALRPPVYRED